MAFVDDRDRLREFMIESISRPPLLEGVYRGRVIKIEKGMGAAFVDIGLCENVFLSRAMALHEGEAVIVQIAREAASGKAPTVRQEILISGSYFIYRPDGEDVRWPRSLKSGRRRDNLEARITGWLLADEGWTIRTQAQYADDAILTAEMTALRARWREVTGKKTADVPSCLLQPPSLVERTLRDRVASDSVILVDDRGVYLELTTRMKRQRPDIAANIKFHDEARPIFESYGIADQIEGLSDRNVTLPRGARLTIDFTEALTVVDVDLGSAGAKGRADDAILATNMSAVVEIARQIRLRNLAGLIVVDFITMRRREHRRKLVDAMKRELKDSSVPVDVLGMTAAGLIEITRRRDGPALHELLTQREFGLIKPSGEVLACDALRQLLRTKGASGFRLIAAPQLASLLRGDFELAFKETTRRLGGALSLIEDNGEMSFRIETENRTGT
jgi:ribonuclease G